ncbi:MAG: YitT family protein [Pseudomonadota bacterium]
MTSSEPSAAATLPAAPSPALPEAAPPAPHTLTEDAVAIFTGVLLISVGVAFFTSAGLLTGGTAGLAFLAHYATGIGFGKLFFVFNLPFYWLALRKLGRAFTVKTFIAVLLLSALTELQSHFLEFAQLQTLYAAIAGGTITGTGFLVLFRHRCSLGGVGIAALYLQDRYGWRAGKIQMAVDCCIVLLALFTMEPLRVLWSIAGAVALNLVLAINHRPGRYMGT